LVNRRVYGWSIFFTALFLSLLGVVFVYTGSYFWCLRQGVSPYSYALKQGVALFISVLSTLFIYRFLNYKDLVNQKVLRLIYLTAIFLLVSVLIFGKEINNSKSWLVIGGFSLQPAEIAKVLIIIFVSAYLRFKWYDIQNDFRIFVAFMFFGLFLPDILILAEGDLGSAMILSLSVFAVLLVTRLNYRYTLLPIGLGFLLFLFAVVTTPYRLMRIKILLHPENYIQTTGKYSSYQLVQAFVAFAKGKLTGLGIGEGIQAKFQFLTYAYSDFMYAHIAEEIGALGAILILLLFLFILYSGLSIADRTDEQIGKYLALGLTTYIFLQAVVHIGVNIGLLPTTGITLPFMSAGGSSLISNFLAVGVLMAVAKSLPSESKVKARVVGKGRYAY